MSAHLDREIHRVDTVLNHLTVSYLAITIISTPLHNAQM